MVTCVHMILWTNTVPLWGCEKKEKGGVGGVSPIHEQRYCSGIVKKKMRGLESLDSLEGLALGGCRFFFTTPLQYLLYFFSDSLRDPY